MDWGEHFEKNFELLRKNKKLLLPLFLSHLAVLLILLSYFHFTGLSVVYSDIAKIQRAYLQFLVNTATGQPLQFELGIEASSADVYSKIFEYLVSPQGILILALVLMISLIIFVYSYCISYSMITATIKNRKDNFFEAVKNSNKVFLKVFAIKIFQKLVYLILVILMLLPTQLIWFASRKITWTVFLIVLPFAIIALFYFSLRMMIVYPSAIAGRRRFFGSVRESFSLTGRAGNHAMYLFSIIVGILFIRVLLLQPIVDLLVGIYASDSVYFIFFSAVLLAVYIFLQSAILIFKEMFTFPAYEEFKK